MDITQPLTLLGGMSPEQFMHRHWQRKPLLVRQAFPGFKPLLDRGMLFELAARDGVESRLVRQQPQWRLRHGPLPRRALPPLSQPGWTLLVQGVDLHDTQAHALLQRFRFVPEARLDDLMISYASDGGGVGPHFDSYDVFLLQAHGQRRWRIGRQKSLALRDDVPLKILADFVPEEEYVLDPGDMLYLPPRYAHDGIAMGECMTYSVGFRSPERGSLARELLVRLAEDQDGAARDVLYRDPHQSAVSTPGAIPQALQDFARQALQHALEEPLALARALGETLTEPKPHVWFEPAASSVPDAWHDHGVVLDRRTRMMYDDRHVYINGESYRASGRDARLMRRLADDRMLEDSVLAGASDDALELLATWLDAGWLHAAGGG